MSSKTALSDSPISEVSEMLCFSIYAAEHAFTQFYRPLLIKLKLTYPQYLVMLTLWARDGRTVKELGVTLFLDSSTLTPLLKRLEAAGLIKRARNPRDEREVLLHLSKRGQALKAEAAEVAQCVQQAVALDAAAVDVIRASVDGIRDRLKDLER